MTDVERKKILGQFFSGGKLGNLLVSLLWQARRFSSVVDPMAGIGDLLLAAKSRVKRNGNIVGVEIDPKAVSECKRRMPTAKIVMSDAFQARCLSIPGGYSSVVTNPPYVRYQLYNKYPRRHDVREGLISQIKRQTHLSTEESDLLISLAANYSGTADLAVPSWILCTSILANDGWLAIIVPETWLSREYALPIQYMLLKMFDVRYIVRDVGASWFDDALVRTCLVVAERKPIQEMSVAGHSSVFCIDLYPKSMSEDSLVGNIQIKNLIGDVAWRYLLETEKPIKNDSIVTRSICMRELFPNLFAFAKRPAWMSVRDFKATPSTYSVHAEMFKMIPKGVSVDWQNLADIGLSCSQGMRTGANEFFYLQRDTSVETCVLHPGKWYPDDIKIPSEFYLPTLKKRCDVGTSYIVGSSNLQYVMLYLRNIIRSSDEAMMSGDAEFKVAASEALDRYITEAEKMLTRNGHPVYDLSAVSPNTRKKNGRYMSLWYQLPRIANRHCPDLALPRVNGGAVQCLYVQQIAKQPIIVDANFTTLWGNDFAAEIGFCLLNSLWFKCYSECMGAILGGGALKLEATAVRKIVFPRYTQDQQNRLFRLSKEFQKANQLSGLLQRKIDMAVLAPFGRKSKVIYKSLCRLLSSKLNERGVML